MEHRWGDRTRCDVVVRLLADPATAAWGRLRDISITGAFIETQLPLPPLSTLHVAACGSAREAGAIVVRRESGGIGIEWFDGDTLAVADMIDQARQRERPAAASAGQLAYQYSKQTAYSKAISNP